MTSNTLFEAVRRDFTTDQILAVLAPHVLASDIEQLRQILTDVASRPRAFE